MSAFGELTLDGLLDRASQHTGEDERDLLLEYIFNNKVDDDLRDFLVNKLIRE